MKHMYGIFAVTTTPFTQDGSIDTDGALKNVNWLIEKGVHGLLPLGATGEYQSLTIDERKIFSKFILEEINGRRPVIINTTSSTAEQTIELTRHAQENGASGVMVLTPPATHASQKEILGYFTSVSNAVELPVMIYNNPGSAGVDIEFKTLQKICRLPHMDYIKESTGDIKRMTLITDILKDGIIPFCGCENLAYESFIVGARGWISVIANVAPKMSVQLFELAAEQRECDKSWALYRKMLPMLRYLEGSGKLWQTVKYIQDKNGLAGGFCRSPRQPLEKSDKEEIDALLESHPLE